MQKGARFKALISLSFSSHASKTLTISDTSHKRFVTLQPRRSLVTSAAALPALAVPAAAVAACSADDARINALWTERTATAGELRKLGREINEATAKMPDWARPGPQISAQRRHLWRGVRGLADDPRWPRGAKRHGDVQHATVTG